MKGMHAEVFGEDGPRVVLLHGNVPPQSLRPLAEDLSDEFLVELVHLPGYGRSEPLDAHSQEAVRDAVLALVRGGSTPVRLVGHSNGAYHALHTAIADGGAHVDRLALLGPLATMADEERAVFGQFAEAIRGGVDLSDAACQRWVAPHWLEANPSFRDRVRRWFEAEADALACDIEATGKMRDLRGELADLDLPVYLRVGELDQATPPDGAREIARRLPDATLDVVPGVGHMLAQEDRAATVQALRGFLG